MGLIFYRVGLAMYSLLLRLMAPFHSKAQKMLAGRRETFTILERALQGNTQPVAWFHCASLGEFEQGRPLMEAFTARYPQYKIVLSFFSPSGYEIRKNYALPTAIVYLPFDSPRQATRFIDCINPSVVFFVKYEFWYHYLRTLHQRQIPLFLVSGIFRKEQIFFRGYGGFYRNILGFFQHLFVQNEASQKLLQQIGISKVSIAGDTRFDRVATIAAQAKAIPQAEVFRQGNKIMVIGSCWKEDLQVLKSFITQGPAELKWIIAPHEIDAATIQFFEQELGNTLIRFSAFEDFQASQHRILLIDNMGMLSSLYQYGDYAYIGGAFGKGLHNILEAATFGLPVFFGNKNYQKFQEAVALIAAQGAFAIGSTEAFTEAFMRLWNQPELDQKTRLLIKEYVKSNTGATEAILSQLKTLPSL
ncbi:glycosyltransferase N-terminal domain-containing protein [Cytophagales bacterium LB-30]|uniref:3-deoxy-D-manno-octulosonic acid transferase n=1 Tax=Shiella aurantiaca TaxID=3058365 RepID=A0ABT8F8X8_9BACT|nr:glycosyltransferase N-terminal domain-containing protein [Shiella aurantiaca]MDN4166927.1 glycosyltransferase N-terminal domain-containing protein [Shiella aurantiaca]